MFSNEESKKFTFRLEILSRLLKSLAVVIDMFVSPKKIDEELVLCVRDALIKRFSLSTDLFWKTLKIYLEEVGGVTLKSVSPKGIIRDAVSARLISEKEGADCMKMIESRNKTSHMYHEDLAEEIAAEIPTFYQLMYDIAKRLKKQN